MQTQKTSYGKSSSNAGDDVKPASSLIIQDQQSMHPVRSQCSGHSRTA